MEGGQSQLDKIEYLSEGGRDRCYSTSKVPLRDQTGAFIGLAGAARDMTEERKIEQELRESKDLLSLAMAGMSDCFAMFDRTGTRLSSATLNMRRCSRSRATSTCPERLLARS